MAPRQPRTGGLTRLLNLSDLNLEQFEINAMPPYFAISHVWSENLFPIYSKHSMASTDGLKMVLLYNEQFLIKVAYCWIDTWCIDQENDDDKRLQIPLMARIYQQAQTVLVTVQQCMGSCQEVWDEASLSLDELTEKVDLMDGLPLDQQLEAHDQISGQIHSIFSLLRWISVLPWNQRIWTAQEYILAKHVVWLGADRSTLQMLPEDIVQACDLWSSFLATLLKPGSQQMPGISERASPLLESISTFRLMNNLRLGKTNSTEVMRLAKTRESTLQEDQIYGLMAASGVAIDPILMESGSMDCLWQRWWERAVIEGHLQWILMPNLERGLQDPAFRNCIKPSFNARCDAAQELDFASVIRAGPIEMKDGTISISARIGGTISFDPYPGNWNAHIESPYEFYASSGTKDAVRRICAALTSGKRSYSAIEEVAFIVDLHVECRPADPGVSPSPGTCERILHRTMNSRDFAFAPEHYYSKGRKYLATIINDYTATSVLVITNDEIIAPSDNNFMALDVSTDQSGWSSRRRTRSFMVVKTPPDGSKGTLHKVGMTYPVAIADPGYAIEQARDLSTLVYDMTLHQFGIGGVSCYYCQILKETDIEMMRVLEAEEDSALEEVT